MEFGLHILGFFDVAIYQKKKGILDGALCILFRDFVLQMKYFSLLMFVFHLPGLTFVFAQGRLRSPYRDTVAGSNTMKNIAVRVMVQKRYI